MDLWKLQTRESVSRTQWRRIKYNKSRYFFLLEKHELNPEELTSVLLQLEIYKGEKTFPPPFLPPSLEGKYDLILLTGTLSVMVTFNHGRGWTDHVLNSVVIYICPEW